MLQKEDIPMKKARNYKIVISLILFLFTVSLNALDLSSCPDSYTVREKIVDTWFEEDLDVIRAKSAEILQTNIGDYFLVRAEEYDGLMEIIVAPLVVQSFDVVEYNQLLENSETVDSTRDVKIETWPKDAVGSWILYRDSLTGKPVKIRQYIKPDSEVYIEFYNSPQKIKADFSIYGGLVANQVPVIVPFEFFYTATIKDMLSVTMRFPWEYTQSYNNSYSDSQYMISVIQKSLPFYNSLDIQKNDSELQFLKWIIDGLASSLVGGPLFDEPLYSSTIDAKEANSSRKNAYKTYNYIRNLATASHSADTGISYTPATASVDVEVEPFSYFVDSDGVKKRVEYLENNGFSNEVLESILYVLASTEQQIFYLGAIREPEILKINGKYTEYYSYNHAVAFFPWFDNDGGFHINVFHDGKELKFDEFLEKHPDCFTHLVRVKSSMNFFPVNSEKD